MSTRTPAILRKRDGEEARVTYAELFFDLIYVFAVTQLSHTLLGELSPLGAVQTLLLWFAVWLGWQYTCWVTNWFDPDAPPIRILLFVIMAVGLLMAAAIPTAFGERGLIFAACYAAIQVGRTLYVLYHLGSDHALVANFRRILAWLSVSAVLWIAGGLADGATRMTLWALAVVCEYASPMIGFRFPGLGRSQTSDWTIEGGHLAERCQLFVIMALGESILVTGATFVQSANWDAPGLIACLVMFIGSVAMWWMYFNLGSRDGSDVIAHSDDPGRIGAYFHYVHAVIVAGVIVTAVGSELVLAHPDGHMTAKYTWVLVGGPVIYVIGNAIYKRIVYGRLPLSHLAGLAGFALLAIFAHRTDLLMVAGLATALLLMIAVWETRSRRSRSKALQAD